MAPRPIEAPSTPAPPALLPSQKPKLSPPTPADVRVARAPTAPDAGLRSVAAGGRRIESTPLMTARAMADVERLGYVLKVVEPLIASGYPDRGEAEEAMRLLEAAGVGRGARAGDRWSSSLSGAAAEAQRLEWHLGQIADVLHEMAHEGRPKDHLHRLSKLARSPEVKVGTDLLLALSEQDAANQRTLRQFVAQERAAGRIDPRDAAYQPLFPSGYGLGYEALAGRKISVLVRDENNDLVRLSGTFAPLGRSAIQGLIPEGGGAPVSFNMNRVDKLMLEHTSAKVEEAFAKLAKAQGNLDELGMKELLREVSFDGLVGRRAAFLVPDEARGEWKLVEGTIHGGKAPFIDIATAQGQVTLNTNGLLKPSRASIEDTSPVKAAHFRSQMREEGYVKRGTAAYNSAVRGGDLRGRRVAALVPDREKGQWEVVRGTMSTDPFPRLQVQAQGGVRTFDPNVLPELWVSRE